jgi:hypothetical protein
VHFSSEIIVIVIVIDCFIFCNVIEFLATYWTAIIRKKPTSDTLVAVMVFAVCGIIRHGFKTNRARVISHYYS